RGLALALADGMTSKLIGIMTAALASAVACTPTQNNASDRGAQSGKGSTQDDPAHRAVARLLEEGRQTFRFDTFGDEAFWSGVLGLDRALASVTPRQALAVGLKVDVDALSADTIAALEAGKVNLDDPAVTAMLVKANAVLGVKAEGTQIGLQCA